MSAVDTRTIPWSWYTDPAVLRLEQERIFRHAWQYVARKDQIAEAGFFASDPKRRPQGVRSLAAQLLPTLREGTDMVFSSTSCGLMLRHEYGPLLNLPGAEELAKDLFDICEFPFRITLAEGQPPRIEEVE